MEEGRFYGYVVYIRCLHCCLAAIFAPPTDTHPQRPRQSNYGGLLRHQAATCAGIQSISAIQEEDPYQGDVHQNFGSCL